MLHRRDKIIYTTNIFHVIVIKGGDNSQMSAQRIYSSISPEKFLNPEDTYGMLDPGRL